MKDLIFKIFVILFLATNIVGCGCLKKQHNNNNNDTNMGASMYGYEMLANSRQIDSICVADTLNPYLSEWITTTFVDYETNKTVIQKMYIKKLSDKDEIIYIVVPKDTLFLITKRIVKSE